MIGQASAWPEPRCTFARRTALVPMPDGVRLATDLYAPELDGPRPCILMRTPYGRRGARVAAEAEGFAAQGYVVAVQDVRGKYDSEGVFAVSANEGADGNASVDWLAGQEWSTGRIGTYGCSYLGESQLQLATHRNPHHVAMIAKAAGGANARFGVLADGAHGLEWALKWFIANGSRGKFELPADFDYDALLRQLPVAGLAAVAGAPPSEWEDFVGREPGDPWWETRNYLREDDRFDVPTLMIDSWWDGAVAEALRIHERMRDRSESRLARDNQYVVIAPTQHCGYEAASEHTVVGDRDFGDARLDYYGLYVRWFDYWLRSEGPGFSSLPKVRYYVMGENAWRSCPAWPPAARTVRLYLGSGRLATEPPVAETADRFVYDPADPMPSVGGQMTDSRTDVTAGAREQTRIEQRDDLLVYTTPRLRSGVEVTGYVKAVLFVSSDAPDTDFTAKLVDVGEDGRAFNVQSGIIRARFRDGYDRSLAMQPGETYRVEIDLHATSMCFAAGHRIRLQVSSSDFPLYDRNLNTGDDNARTTRTVPATNAVHHGPGVASHLVVPIVAGELEFEEEK